VFGRVSNVGDRSWFVAMVSGVGPFDSVETEPADLGSVRDVHFVDLPTGHWPMFSRPADLAAVLQDEIRR